MQKTKGMVIVQAQIVIFSQYLLKFVDGQNVMLSNRYHPNRQNETMLNKVHLILWKKEQVTWKIDISKKMEHYPCSAQNNIYHFHFLLWSKVNVGYIFTHIVKIRQRKTNLTLDHNRILTTDLVIFLMFTRNLKQIYKSISITYKANDHCQNNDDLWQFFLRWHKLLYLKTESNPELQNTHPKQ